MEPFDPKLEAFRRLSEVSSIIAFAGNAWENVMRGDRLLREDETEQARKMCRNVRAELQKIEESVDHFERLNYTA